MAAGSGWERLKRRFLHQPRHPALSYREARTYFYQKASFLPTSASKDKMRGQQESTREMPVMSWENRGGRVPDTPKPSCASLSRPEVLST